MDVGSAVCYCEFLLEWLKAFLYLAFGEEGSVGISHWWKLRGLMHVVGDAEDG